MPGTASGSVLAGLYPGDALAEANKKRMLDEATQMASEYEVAREAADAGKEQGHGGGDTSGGGENPIDTSAMEPSEANVLDLVNEMRIVQLLPSLLPLYNPS